MSKRLRLRAAAVLVPTAAFLVTTAALVITVHRRNNTISSLRTMIFSKNQCDDRH